MAEHDVVVHGVGDDLGHLGRGELEEGEVLGGAGFAAAREAHVVDGAELAEVGAHFVFVEAVGDASGCPPSVEDMAE